VEVGKGEKGAMEARDEGRNAWGVTQGGGGKVRAGY